MLVAILILGTPILAWACSVPVFRYALELWPPDEYEVVLFHQGSLTEEQKQLIEGKRADFDQRGGQKDAFASNRFPEGAQLCGKCNTAASVMLDGCLTCLNCGYSKCG